MTIMKNIDPSPGVYIIYNKITKKRYVGSSKNVRTRLQSHFRQLVRGKHENRLLQKDFDTYGEDNFSYLIKEYCHYDRILEVEQKWIDRLDNLYNINDKVTGGNKIRIYH